jgi:hypothetical protein
LVAAFVGAGHNLGCGQVAAGGDVEEVADLVEQVSAYDLIWRGAYDLTS